MSCASPWNARSQTAGGPAGRHSPFWPKGGFEPGSSAKCGWWTLGPVGFVGMVLGFVFFWPIGLAILFYNIWNRKGQSMPIFQSMERYFENAPFARQATGNMAFDEWRRTELERIEKERQKLADAEREFAVFSDELRRARDREEFERFMQAHRGGAKPEAQS